MPHGIQEENKLNAQTRFTCLYHVFCTCVTTRYDHRVTRELSPGDSVDDEVEQVRSAYKQTTNKFLINIQFTIYTIFDIYSEKYSE